MPLPNSGKRDGRYGSEKFFFFCPVSDICFDGTRKEEVGMHHSASERRTHTYIGGDDDMNMPDRLKHVKVNSRVVTIIVFVAQYIVYVALHGWPFVMSGLLCEAVCVDNL